MMCKFAPWACLLFLGAAAHAQTQKGYWMAGGNFGGFTYASSGADNRSYNFNVNPTLGYFVAPRFAVGGLLSVGISGVKSVEGSMSSTFNYGLSPFARYYFGNDERDKYFVQGKFNTGGLKQTYLSPTSYIGYGLGVGYDHFFVTAVALEIGLGYDFLHPSVGRDENNFGVNLGLLLFLPGKREKKAAAALQD